MKSAYLEVNTKEDNVFVDSKKMTEDEFQALKEKIHKKAIQIKKRNILFLTVFILISIILLYFGFNIVLG